jgi:arsenate reductase-like glutaredoxin family protein
MLVVALALCALACRAEPAAGGADAAGGEGLPAALKGFVVKRGNPHLVFQYFEPGTGQPVTVTDPDKVPEQARSAVVVFCSDLAKGDVPAELVIVADLTQMQEDGCYPYKLVSRYSQGEGQGKGESPGSCVVPPRPAPAGEEVVLFVAQWCPHCREAKQWLTAHQVKFTERDVENDPAAREELARLGQKQGLPANLLSTVPILYVRGKLVIGFNPEEVARLLGIA